MKHRTKTIPVKFIDDIDKKKIDATIKKLNNWLPSHQQIVGWVESASAFYLYFEVKSFDLPQYQNDQNDSYMSGLLHGALLSAGFKIR